ncbi:MAG: DUF1573 domain-containing protein [Rikenellaceae bacterium]
MSNLRVIFLIISVLGCVNGVIARGLKFLEPVHNFGSIAEDGGVVSHRFEIVNEGSKPVVIYNMSTSCGCTTTDYSREPIAKGGRVELGVTFDPLFRVGRFSKSIYVYNSGSDEPQELKIEGVVTPRVLALEERYPYMLCDSLRIGALNVDFRAVPQGRLVQQSVEFRNLATRERVLEFRSRDEGALQLHYEARLGANEGATLEVGYFVERGRGRLIDRVDVYVDGVRIDKYITVRGLIVE